MPLLDADLALGFFILFGTIFLYLTPLWLLLGAWLVGRGIQRRHLASLESREADVGRRIVVTNQKSLPEGADPNKGELVSGSVVIGTDYFRRFLSSFRLLVGGRVRSIEPMLMRARREAVLRMLEKADRTGANLVVNVRVDTSTLRLNANRQQQHAMAEVVAYGTAVKTTLDNSPYGGSIDNSRN